MEWKTAWHTLLKNPSNNWLSIIYIYSYMMYELRNKKTKEWLFRHRADHFSLSVYQSNLFRDHLTCTAQFCYEVFWNGLRDPRFARFSQSSRSQSVIFREFEDIAEFYGRVARIGMSKSIIEYHSILWGWLVFISIVIRIFQASKAKESSKSQMTKKL